MQQPLFSNPFIITLGSSSEQAGGGWWVASSSVMCSTNHVRYSTTSSLSWPSIYTPERWRCGLKSALKSGPCGHMLAQSIQEFFGMNTIGLTESLPLWYLHGLKPSLWSQLDAVLTTIFLGNPGGRGELGSSSVLTHRQKDAAVRLGFPLTFVFSLT